MSLENLKKDDSSLNEISLKELILKMQMWVRYLLSNWLIVTVFVSFGAAVGVTYSYYKKPIFIAVTTFVLEDGASNNGTSFGGLGGLASMAGIDIGGGGGIFQGDNILELYRSRTMIENTLLTEVEYNGKRELIIDRYIAFNKLRERWEKKPFLKNIQFKAVRSQINGSKKLNFNRLQDSIIGTIANDINKNYLSVIKPDKKLSIIKAVVRTQDEFFSKIFNNEIVRNVNDFYIQTKTKKSQENIAILQQKVDSVRTVMTGAIYSSASVSDATPNLNPTRQVQRIAPMQKSQFTAETNKAILGELLKNLELSKIANRKETPLIQIIDEPVLPLEKEAFGKLKGLIIGGFLGGFLICIVLVIRRLFKSILL